MKKFYAIKCKTNAGNTLYFCHQIIYGIKQNTFVMNVNCALFYNIDQLNVAEMELIKIMIDNQIKSYSLEKM